jgi:putative transposase
VDCYSFNVTDSHRLFLAGFPGAPLKSNAPLEGAKPRVVHDHGGEFVNRDVSAVVKAHNLIDIKTKPRHPESNGIVERFNGTGRDESNNDYGDNYLQAEAIIAKLMSHYNEERLHAALGYMTPAIWHRGKPEEVREERAKRIAAARTNRKIINQQRFKQAA